MKINLTDEEAELAKSAVKSKAGDEGYDFKAMNVLFVKLGGHDEFNIRLDEVLPY
ncbi:MAG: hypothetical protein IIB38_03185, partial [Candidatus Hydrogenedentes bacterium]|nr:hypothetical protein [Candidatus Hydrogenedentota bacterium]